MILLFMGKYGFTIETCLECACTTDILPGARSESQLVEHLSKKVAWKRYFKK